MTRRAWFVHVSVPLTALFFLGCNNKGKRANVKVEVSEKLKEMGVSLEDWRYSEKEKSFGIKLKTSKPVPKVMALVIRVPGVGPVISPVSPAERINSGEWIDYGGSRAFGNPFANFPESGTIIIDVK